MSWSRLLKLFCAGLVAAAALQPSLLFACAACYGQSDAPMAHGMNWGIMSLLAVIGTVLMGVASFFVYLARRAAAMPADDLPANVAGATESL